MTVVMNSKNYEVTTYRIEDKYIRNRKPESVRFTSSLTEDLSRRDFTVNAMAYNPSRGLVDPFNGLEDIGKKLLRTVGDAYARFSEDALRMLRCIRFSAQLGFSIDADTFDAICRNSMLIKNISSERIRDELNKILLSKRPEKFSLLKDTGILKYVMNEFTECFYTTQKCQSVDYSIAEHSLNAVKIIEADKVLRWTMLLHDIGKPTVRSTCSEGECFPSYQEKSAEIAKKILSRLKFDNNTANRILKLINYSNLSVKALPESVREAAASVGPDIFEDLLKVMEADAKAMGPEYAEKNLIHIYKVKEIFEEIKSQKQCLSIKELAVKGSDLIEIGFEEGKKIGFVLSELLKTVIKQPELNTYEHLIQEAKNLLNSKLT